ncbi:OmpA family protein [Cellvibrio sp. UBA7661]|uniref:OmpA family protein n=1 Tax=Cellvibrio sp. UBA7661 TaxID=1946311 RepID=UPI002F3518A8
MKLFTIHPTQHAKYFFRPFFMVATSLLILGGCATTSKIPADAIAARDRLTQLQNDPELSSRVSVAIRTAESAVREAEIPRKDQALSDHLVFVATREVDIAWAQANTRYLEDQRARLTEQRNTERLQSRTREADRAQYDADQAREESNELRRQIAELNAKATERGLVVTLGDMLFETGKSQLKGNAAENLAKLSSFLTNYPNRTLIIEGHTDNVGSEASNQTLSLHRAESVRSYLLQQGISEHRLSVYGKGENYPVASNDSISGRALNRRVEAIITDNLTVAQ